MVYFMENPIELDDLGVPLFQETSTFRWQGTTCHAHLPCPLAMLCHCLHVVCLSADTNRPSLQPTTSTRRRAFCMVTLACASRQTMAIAMGHPWQQCSSNKSLAKVSIDMANLSYNISFYFILQHFLACLVQSCTA